MVLHPDLCTSYSSWSCLCSFPVRLPLCDEADHGAEPGSAACVLFPFSAVYLFGHFSVVELTMGLNRNLCTSYSSWSCSCSLSVR